MSDPQEGPRFARPARVGLRRALAVAAVATTAALGAILAGAAPAAAAGPTVTVTPSTGLSDGQTVTVKGAGFTPNFAQMVVVQCAASATGANGCDTNDVKFTKADANGAFSVQLTLRSKFGSTDCTKVTCIVQGHEGFNASSGKTGTSAPLHFGAAAQPAPTKTPASTPAGPPAAGGSAGVEPTSAAGAGGAGNGGGNGGAGALPTGANSGRAAVSSVPLLSEVTAALAAALLIGAGIAYRRRPGTHRR